MPIILNFPLYYAPEATHSGIVNSHGNIVHKEPTENIKGRPKYSLSYVFPNISENTTGSGLSLSYIESTRPYTTFPLGFFYTTEALMGIKKGQYDISSFLNVISIDNLPVYLVPTIQNDVDLESFLRTNTRNYSDISTEFTIIFEYQTRQIYTKDNYVYAATSDGIEIFDSNTDSSVYHRITPEHRVDALWGTSDTLYFGGTGLFSVKYQDLNTDFANAVLTPVNTSTSNNIKYIHGIDKAILFTTYSGVEYISYANNPTIKSHSFISNATRCFLTSNKAYYINYTTTSGNVIYHLNRIDSLITDWIMPSYTYSTDGTIFQSNIYLTDMFITEQTASNGGNTIFCTTSSGVYVIDEDTQEYVVYYKR